MKIFQEHTDVTAALSKKEDGSCRLWPDEAMNQKSFKNRERFFNSIGAKASNTLGSVLTHSNNVMTVTARDRGRVFSEVDGFVTAEPDVFLSVTVADCMPVFLYDPGARVVGLLHAGWRGLHKGILGVGIRKMALIGAKPENISAFIGAHIQSCHFEVKEDVLQKFEEYSASLEREGKTFLELKSIAAKQLADLGLNKIEVSRECTACLPEYFSYRRDQPPILEAMVAVLGMNLHPASFLFSEHGF